MATKISEATNTTSPQTTDFVPLGRPADATARYVTLDALVKAVQASSSGRGSVELATTAEAQAGSDTERAVTPAGLASYFNQTVELDYNGRFAWTGETATVQFVVSTGEGNFDGVKDPVMYWGWNITPNGRLDTDTGALWQQYEHDYYVPPKHYMEWNFNGIDDSGNSERYLAFLMDKDDHEEAYWWFFIGNHDNSFFMITDPAASNNLVEVYAQDGYPLLKVGGAVAATSGLSGGALSIVPVITSTNHSDLYGSYFAPTITAGDGSNISTLATMVLNPPDITVTGGSTLYYPVTLLINDAPDEGEYPWALWVNSGYTLLVDPVAFGGSQLDRPTDPVDIVAGTLRQRVAKTPSSAGDTGRTGQICWDSSYVYVCVDTNTWKRCEISTWA